MDEFRQGLELATDEELQDLTQILFRRKFNPLDYVCTPQPLDVETSDRTQWIDALDERFRFLAADGLTVLQQKSQQFCYRDALVQICRYLKISYDSTFSTLDLEVEVFLHLLSRAWEQLPDEDKRLLNQQMQRSLTQSQLAKQLPFSLKRNPMGVLLSGSGAVALHSVVRPWVLQQIARKIAIQMATYQLSRQAVAKGSTTIATQAALRTAYRGVVVNTARYAAVRSVLTVVSSAMWMWFLADLGWRAIATNYGRIIPVVFTIAQIRLTRGDIDLAYEGMA